MTRANLFAACDFAPLKLSTRDARLNWTNNNNNWSKREGKKEYVKKRRERKLDGKN